ncbi:hypothetical protein OAO87_02560, partial [bacterium]|nr:hypothetical protein [bacterium]
MVPEAALIEPVLPTGTHRDQLIGSTFVGQAASILVYGEVQIRTFPKDFSLALSRDVGTVRVHRDSEALRRCKSGTGPR